MNSTCIRTRKVKGERWTKIVSEYCICVYVCVCERERERERHLRHPHKKKNQGSLTEVKVIADRACFMVCRLLCLKKNFRKSLEKC